MRGLRDSHAAFSCSLCRGFNKLASVSFRKNGIEGRVMLANSNGMAIG